MLNVTLCILGKKLQIDSYSYSYITREKPFNTLLYMYNTTND